MTLRTRLIATSLAVVVPLAGLLLVIDDRLRSADQLERLTEFAESERASGVFDRCVANGGMRGRPSRGGGPGPGRGGRGRGGGGPDGRLGGSEGPRDGRGLSPRPADSRPYDLYSYGADFTPADRNMPPIDERLQAALATAETASASFTSTEGRGMQLAMWLDRNDAHCAVLVLRMPPRRGELRDRVTAMALILFSVVAATWLAAGPVLRRLRQLTSDVRRSAETHYATPVPTTGGDEVTSLAVAFNDAGAEVRRHLIELQHREDSLRQFVANTAHDVGLPLTVLQGHLADLEAASTSSSADLKVRGYDGHHTDGRHTDGHHTDLIRSAMREAHYLGSLIRNLNAATRLDAVGTPIEKHPVDLAALVERVVARHSVVARARQVELNYAVPEAPITKLADVTLLEQAVGNLVDNAIRHNREGGHVAIVLDRADGGFTLTVTDDGPGVAEADLARLTERWFRADDARTRRPDGQGLGLAIAAESVKRLGFTLAFSRPTEGGLRAEMKSGINSSN